jgi:NADPH-dependent 2,4-dienoyl-CoA reductase/sulfur reductase-like enzyme/nitrite reductase/ring-hydroxylating ferredoxin subunit
MTRDERKIGRLDDIPEGQLSEVTVDDIPVLLVRRDGQIVALEARCPHHGAPLAEGQLCEGRVICPWHCAAFDVQTGRLLDPPALDGLRKYPVRVEGDDVLVRLPDKTTETEIAPENDVERDRDKRQQENRIIAIVGAGAAGSAAAEAIRELGYRGRVLLIGDDHPPYDRTACSKQYLAGQISDDKLPLRSPEFYNRKGIECLGRRVSSVDVRTGTVIFERAEGIVADKVLLATGAAPIPLDVPGNDLGGVFTLRTWGDSRTIREKAQRSEHAVVVGDGFVGMEVAASLADYDCQVTVISRNRPPMVTKFGKEVGQRLQKLHEENGTRFRLEHEVRALLGEGNLESVELDDGSQLPADIVVVGIGVRPNTDIVAGYPKNPDGSIDIDEYLRLNDNVYAAGDIACYPGPYSTRRIRVEHWRLAQQQGRTAAANMVRPAVPFDGVPFFWTRQFGVSLTCAGHADEWDEVILTGDPDALQFSAYYAKDGRLVAIVGTQTERTTAFMQQMRAGRLPSPDSLGGITFAARELSLQSKVLHR